MYMHIHICVCMCVYIYVYTHIHIRLAGSATFEASSTPAKRNDHLLPLKVSARRRQMRAMTAPAGSRVGS